LSVCAGEAEAPVEIGEQLLTAAVELCPRRCRGQETREACPMAQRQGSAAHRRV
jgi:hypothetical protein